MQDEAATEEVQALTRGGRRGRASGESSQPSFIRQTIRSQPIHTEPPSGWHLRMDSATYL